VSKTAMPALEVKRVPLASLVPDQHNARTHSAKNIAAIKASLADFGQRLPLVVRDGVVLGGNATMSAMRELGWTEVDVTEFVGTESQARMLKIALNRTAELASWDYKILGEDLKGILADVGGDFDAMASFGWEKHEIDPLINAQWIPDEEGLLGGERDANGEKVKPIKLTGLQALTIYKAIEAWRERSGKAKASDGDALVGICAVYLENAPDA
jgi:hypothetical protein